MAARDGFEPSLTASKAAILPLDDLAMERVTGFAPVTFSLARRHSTTELHPLAVPRDRVELSSHVFQTRAVTTLATSANIFNVCGRERTRTSDLLCVRETL